MGGNNMASKEDIKDNFEVIKQKTNNEPLFIWEKGKGLRPNNDSKK